MANDELLARLAVLEQENMTLRALASPQDVAPVSSSSPPSEDKPSKLETFLTSLIKQTEELTLPNNPNVDGTQQNMLRTQALAKTVISLTKAIATGFGATGAVLTNVSRGLEVLREEAKASREGTATVQPSSSVETEAGEEIEVDNTGAPEGHPAVAATKARNGKRSGRPAAPVAASPAGPPVGPPPSAPAGMPAEVANLPQGPLAPIASVTVK